MVFTIDRDVETKGDNHDFRLSYRRTMIAPKNCSDWLCFYIFIDQGPRMQLEISLIIVAVNIVVAVLATITIINNNNK